MKVLWLFALCALFATAFGFPNVEEFEIIEDEFEEAVDEFDKEFDEGMTLGDRLFDLVSEIESNPRRATKLTSFSYKDCGGPSANVNVNSLSITPDPLKSPFTVATNFKINNDVAAPVKASLKLYREILGKFIELPCVDNIGSCTYDDACKLLAPVTCPDSIKRIGIDCHCPFKANTYSFPPTAFTLDDISKVPSGTYRASLEVPFEGKEGLCLEITLTLS